MEYKEFLNAVCDYMNEVATDVSVSIHSTPKNNGVILWGLMFKREGYNASPMIYMDSYYEEYLEGTDISDIGDKLLALYQENDMSVTVDMSFFDSFESVKDRLFIKLVNLSKNREFLEEVPYEPFLDLAIVAYVRMHDEQLGDGIIMVRNEHLKIWGVDGQSVLDAAKKNTHDNDGFSLTHILDAMEDNGEDVDEDMEDFPMFIATNERMINGASVLTMSDKLREYADIMGGDYYIIPSSVHELLLFACDDSDEPGEIDKMIREVNTTQLGPDDVLSDHVYRYSINDDVLLF